MSVSVVRACWASIWEAVSCSHGAATASKRCEPAAQIMMVAILTQVSATESSTVAARKPRLKRRRVSRHSHHCAARRKNTAATKPDSGTHCGRVSAFCSCVTLALVRRKSSRASGRMSSRMSVEALDM